MRKQLLKSLFHSTAACLAYVIIFIAVFSFEATYAGTGNDESWWKYQSVYDDILGNDHAVNPLHDKDCPTTHLE